MKHEISLCAFTLLTLFKALLHRQQGPGVANTEAHSDRAKVSPGRSHFLQHFTAYVATEGASII